MTNKPKISVCMAAYQGERYIAAQLRSILAQLSENDEVIVVDDHSSDRTCEEVGSLSDTRVHLVEHRTNQGVAHTYQEALSQATGSVRFLRDQANLCVRGKVATVLHAFQRNRDETLLVSGAQLMNEAENALG